VLTRWPFNRFLFSLSSQTESHTCCITQAQHLSSAFSPRLILDPDAARNLLLPLLTISSHGDSLSATRLNLLPLPLNSAEVRRGERLLLVAVRLPSATWSTWAAMSSS
jgi:hypothetical protein